MIFVIDSDVRGRRECWKGEKGDMEDEQICEVFRAARVVVALRLHPAPASMAGASPHDD